jgi:hypothetical protein
MRFKVVSESVVKDRERHCLLIALIVRLMSVIICKDLTSARKPLRLCSVQVFGIAAWLRAY